MWQRAWLLMGMALLLAGCAPEFRVETLGTAEKDYRALNVVYFKSDAPQVREPALSDFVVQSDTPEVQVEVVGWKHDKVRRPQQQRQLSILIAWDQSSSLSETDPERKRFPAGQRLVNDLPASARLGLVSFASLGLSYGDYDVRAPMGSDKARILQELQFLNQSDFSAHGTPLWNTLCDAIPRMLAHEPPERERWVVLFTDGQNDTPVPSRSEYDALQTAHQHRVRLVFVFLGNEESIPHYAEVRQTLEYLANATGGAVVAVEQAQDLREAFGSVLDILEYAPCYNLHLRVRKAGGFQQGEPLTLRIRLATGNERVVQVRL